jgi:hypothetical protein
MVFHEHAGPRLRMDSFPTRRLGAFTLRRIRGLAYLRSLARAERVESRRHATMTLRLPAPIGPPAFEATQALLLRAALVDF